MDKPVSNNTFSIHGPVQFAKFNGSQLARIMKTLNITDAKLSGFTVCIIRYIPSVPVIRQMHEVLSES